MSAKPHLILVFMKPKSNKIYIIIASLALILFSGFRTDYFEISKQLDIFATLFKELNIYYVDDTDPDELIHEAIEGMLKTLDPYTTFMTEDEAEDFKIHTSGEYAGIGASIRIIDKEVVITQVYEGFAADKAGIKSGDVLLEIDGKKINKQNASIISTSLKGSVNSKVEIRYRRLGVKNPITVEFSREKIIVNAVPYFGMIDNEVGYIILNSFSRKATKEIGSAFDKLKQEGMKSLILDLRGNPGGLLSQAVDVSGLFLPRNTFVVETKGKIQDWNKKYTTRLKPRDTEIPIVVLTDFGTASASEIVAGALQDLDRAVIMGSRTFGKGLVQQPRSLNYGTKLKITIAKYYIPSGRCIQAKDYFNKDKNGRPKVIPDSLRVEFATEGGRRVYDGAGIEPDVNIDQENLSPLVSSLLNQNVFFKYSVYYCNMTENKVDLSKFSVSTKDLSDFELYAHNNGFIYKTKLTEKLSEFKDITIDENSYSELENIISKLESELEKSNSEIFKKESDRIKEILELSIINNDYNESGRYQYSIRNDDLIIKATDLLNDKARYEELLAIKK